MCFGNRNRSSRWNRKEKDFFSIQSLAVGVSLAHKWTIPLPLWSCIFLIFGTRSLASHHFFFTTACSLDYVIISVSLHPESDSSVLLSDESLGFFSLCVSLLFIVLLVDLPPLGPVYISRPVILGTPLSCRLLWLYVILVHLLCTCCSHAGIWTVTQ